MAKKELTRKEEISKDISKQASLEAVGFSEGGQMIIKELKKDIVGAINAIAYSYKTLSHASLIGHCASLAEKIAVLKVMTGASKRKKIAERDLTEYIKENPNEDDE